MIYDAIIVGGGAVGCATARELSRYDLRIALCEKGEDVCVGTSKANSAIVHAGFDAVTGTKKAQFNVAGSRMMERLSYELDFPYRRNGALVVCFDEKDKPRLEELLHRGEANGVEGLRIVDGEELHRLEPALSPAAVAALYAPSAIVCPFGMTIALAENAAKNGVEFFMNSPVTAISRKDGLYELTAGGKVMKTRTVVNAAGVYSDELHNMVCDAKLSITPRSGEYCLLDKKDGHLVERTIFQLPGKLGKGVLVTPTVHGNLLIGPTAVDRDDKDATDTTADGLAYATEMAGVSVPNLPMRDTITSFCGLRAHLTGGSDDFVIGESADGFFDAVGIESPGLTGSVPLARYVIGLMLEHEKFEANPGFDPHHKGIVKFAECTPEQQAELIAQDPDYGEMICSCEEVTKAEILQAIHNPLGVSTMTGIKYRTRAMMGGCQGGFCQMKIEHFIEQELGTEPENVRYSRQGSWVLTGNMRKEEN